MHRQATELNSAYSYAFTALVRKDSEFQRPHRLALSERGFTPKTGILQLQMAIPKGLCRRAQIYPGRYHH